MWKCHGGRPSLVHCMVVGPNVLPLPLPTGGQQCSECGLQQLHAAARRTAPCTLWPFVHKQSWQRNLDITQEKQQQSLCKQLLSTPSPSSQGHGWAASRHGPLLCRASANGTLLCNTCPWCFCSPCTHADLFWELTEAALCSRHHLALLHSMARTRSAGVTGRTWHQALPQNRGEGVVWTLWQHG